MVDKCSSGENCMVNKFLTKYRKMSVMAKASIAYVIANLICKGFSIITIPIFTHIMPSSEIGIVSVFNSWWGILCTVGTLALTSGGFFTALAEYENHRKEYVSSILALVSVVTAVLITLFFVDSDFWMDVMGLRKILIFVLILSISLESAKDMWMMCQRYEYRYKSVFIVTVLVTALSFVVSIYAVCIASKRGYTDLATVRLISTYIVFFIVDIVLYIKILRDGKTIYNKEYWLFSLRISIPLIFNALAKSVLDISDKLMIAKFIGNSEAGVYSTVYSISSLVVIIWTAINNSFVPFLYQKLKDQENVFCDVKKFIMPLLIVYGVFAVVMTLIAPEAIGLLTTDEYLSAVNIVPPVVAGVYLTCLYNLFADVLVFYKKTNYIMMSTTVACIVNLGLNYILIPKYGYTIAAYTTLIAYIILSITQYFAMKKVSSNKIYDMKFILLLTIVIIGTCILLNGLYHEIIIRYCIFAVLVFFIIYILKRKKIDNISD